MPEMTGVSKKHAVLIGSPSARSTRGAGCSIFSTTNGGSIVMESITEFYHAGRAEMNEVTGLCTPGHLSSFSGVSVGRVSADDAFLEPVQHFVLNPSHPVGAKPYPLRELAGRFQPRDMLWRVENQLLHLPFR